MRFVLSFFVVLGFREDVSDREELGWIRCGVVGDDRE